MSTPAPQPEFRAHLAVLVFVWLLVVCVQFWSTFALDPNALCYRAWECATTTAYERPFKPRFVRDATSSGDLGHMSGLPALQRSRREKFTIDEFGFRNPVGSLAAGCELVVAGDSFAAGSYLGDEELLSGLLRTRAGLRVYNYAGVPLVNYFLDQRFTAQPPKWLVLLMLERNLWQMRFPTVHAARMFSAPAFAETPVEPVDQVTRIHDAFERSPYFAQLLEPRYKELLDRLGLYRCPETIYYCDRASGFLFHSEGVRPSLVPEHTRENVHAAVRALARFSALLKQHGIRLLVLNAPDKSTLYGDLVPQLRGIDTTAAYREGQALLQRAGVDNLDLLALFQAARRADPERTLYFKDDTHMNAHANLLAFAAVLAHIRASELAEPRRERLGSPASSF